jgi:hypothetical protein
LCGAPAQERFCAACRSRGNDYSRRSSPFICPRQAFSAARPFGVRRARVSGFLPRNFETFYDFDRGGLFELREVDREIPFRQTGRLVNRSVDIIRAASGSWQTRSSTARRCPYREAGQATAPVPHRYRDQDSTSGCASHGEWYENIGIRWFAMLSRCCWS